MQAAAAPRRQRRPRDRQNPNRNGQRYQQRQQREREPAPEPNGCWEETLHAVGNIVHSMRSCTVRSKKLAVGSFAATAGTILVIAGLCTQAWVTGSRLSAIGNARKEDYEIGLFRTTKTTSSAFEDAVTITYSNTGDFLTAGETCLMFCIPGLLGSALASFVSLLMATGGMVHSKNLGHKVIIWSAFCGGLSFIVASIAYSAVVPKIEPLTFGWSFVIVLTSGFFVLIGGLIFVLSKQESWPDNPHDVLRGLVPPPQGAV